MGADHSQQCQSHTQHRTQDHGQKDSTPTLIGSVQRALRLLEAMNAEGGVTAKRLARLTGIPLPSVYHLLRTLSHEGYVLREGGSFRLSDDLPLAS
ncbi:helix-turn-helix domain-containing protein [Streptomyces subrutilus]|uniref:IclR family transcriptional regulator n=1 Tax=Streptomyces subrutilus TaxID=36818 RepID=A0A1E5PMN5_9ACTN|nr:IclR family transcriptional regulator [Streptomyces subrutilus]